MKVYTVKEMHAFFTKLMGEGKGSNVILVPNNDTDEIDAYYRTVGSVEADDEIVYLDVNSNDDEKEYWKEIEGE
jgi:hypothetical protein